MSSTHHLPPTSRYGASVFEFITEKRSKKLQTKGKRKYKKAEADERRKAAMRPEPLFAKARKIFIKTFTRLRAK